MSTVAVDLERLAEVVDQMERFAAHLGNLRALTDARVRAVREVWSGDAAGAYAAAQDEWRAGTAEVHEALAALRSVAGTAHANYTAALVTNRRMWRR